MLVGGLQNFECSGNFNFVELASINKENATIVKVCVIFFIHFTLIILH